MSIDNHYIDPVTQREYDMIIDVIKNYNVSCERLTKIRNVYKIETDKGTFCLKRVKHGKSKVVSGFNIAEQLLNNNFENIPKHYKTFFDESYVEYKGFIFYMTDWIEGNECDFNDFNEAICCSKLLAKFHSSVNTIGLNTRKIKINLRNWPKIIYHVLLDIEKLKKYISRKKFMNEFDDLYSKYIDLYYNRAIIALSMINQSTYLQLSRISKEQKTISYNKFNCHNVIKNKDEYYLTNLDSIAVDIQILDLGKFIKRILNRSEYKWNFQYAKALFEAYSSYKSISVDELKLVLAFIILPRKFCKLGKRRYLKHKDWDDLKYTTKFNRIINYCEEEQLFIEEFIQYINSYQDALLQ